MELLKEKKKNTWKINVFNMNMICEWKKKNEYFHNPWIKILFNFFLKLLFRIW